VGEIGKSVGNLVKDAANSLLNPPPKKYKLSTGAIFGITFGSISLFVCLIYCLKGFLEDPECL